MNGTNRKTTPSSKAKSSFSAYYVSKKELTQAFSQIMSEKDAGRFVNYLITGKHIKNNLGLSKEEYFRTIGPKARKVVRRPPQRDDPETIAKQIKKPDDRNESQNNINWNNIRLMGFRSFQNRTFPLGRAHYKARDSRISAGVRFLKVQKNIPGVAGKGFDLVGSFYSKGKATTAYAINLKGPTIIAIAKALDIMLRINILESAVSVTCLDGRPFVRINIPSGAACLIREAMLRENRTINAEHYTQFDGECVNNDLNCKLLENSKCTITKANVEELMKKLCKKHLFFKAGDDYEYIFSNILYVPSTP